MNRFAIFLFALTVAGSLALLGMSFWPGLLSDAVFLGILLMIPLAALSLVAIVVAAIAFARGWRPGPLQPNGKRLLFAVPVIAAATLALLATHVPCRLAFWSSRRSGFEAAANELESPVDPVQGYTREALERRLGVYLVDEYGVDARGGIYFRVSTGHDGIGPDQMSYGFARRPNSEGSPFGAAHYSLIHLSGDWYLFAASDDYF